MFGSLVQGCHMSMCVRNFGGFYILNFHSFTLSFSLSLSTRSLGESWYSPTDLCDPMVHVPLHQPALLGHCAQHMRPALPRRLVIIGVN